MIVDEDPAIPLQRRVRAGYLAAAKVPDVLGLSAEEARPVVATLRRGIPYGDRPGGDERLYLIPASAITGSCRDERRARRGRLPTTERQNPPMTTVSITTGDIDVGLLREQRNWVLALPESEEREGLTHILDHLLDRAEGYPDTEPGAVSDASSIEGDPMNAQRRGL